MDIVPVGTDVSSVITAVAAALVLPAASLAVTDILFAPWVRLVNGHDHVVEVEQVTLPTLAVLHTTIIEEVSEDFVPVMVWELILVGLVTALITGAGGAIVSRVMLAGMAADNVPAKFLNLT